MKEHEMIAEKSFIERLKIFGLNSYEAKLWAALLSRGSAGAGELAEVSSVPRSRSYDVLQSLEKKGFILTQSKKPIKYKAVSPKEVIERIKTKIMENTTGDLDELQELERSQILETLSSLHEKGTKNIEEVEMCGSIRGRENIYHHLSMMIKDAKESITLMSTEEGMRSKYSKLSVQLEEAKKRGINISFVIPKNTERVLVEDLKRTGSVHFSRKPGRMCIVDNNQTVFMLHHNKDVHKNYDVGVWVNAPYFSNNLSEMVL
jgi:sugar-specific transcriptional regulator TrmB